MVGPDKEDVNKAGGVASVHISTVVCVTTSILVAALSMEPFSAQEIFL